MKRRRLMLFSAGIMASAPFGVRAQPKSKLRIGSLSAGGSRNDRYSGFTALFERLGELGYVEGLNLEADFVLARNAEPLTSFRALVRRGADVLFVMGTDADLLAARIAAADRVPIVMVADSFDPVENGYVESLARPGGNITGVFIRQPELAVKRVEFAHELFPSGRLMVIWTEPLQQQQTEAALKAARSLGLDVQSVSAADGRTYETAFQRIQSFGSPATVLPASWELRRDLDMICRMALERRIPLVAPGREFVEAGAILSYGVRLDDAYRQAAGYIYRVAGGTKPADLPIQQPTRFELSINGRVARVLGIAPTPTILARADEVIE